MRVGSLFSGIGGLDLGLEACGVGPVLWQVESDEFCRSILARHFPRAARDVHDVRLAGAANLAPVDVVAGGFPCQPHSLAGRREAQEDERWLWPDFARIVGELGPRFVFLENVFGFLSSGRGGALAEVLGSLASLGYAGEWDCFRGDEVGAPHRRERWFLLAYALRGTPQRRQPQRVRGSALPPGAGGGGEDRGAGDPAGVGLADPSCARLEERFGLPGDAGAERPPALRGDADAAAGAAQPRVGRGPHGVPLGLDGPWPAGRGEAQHEWEPPRTAHKVAQRPARLKALGNAVIPAQAALAWRVLHARVQAQIARAA